MSLILQDVLTLDEVARYLRVPKKIIERQASQGRIPGRRIEESWRFLKKAIDHWLESHDSRDILLYQAGALADDQNLDKLRASIYAQRGRPEVEVENEEEG
ncbi:MAG: hypothetical protein QG657_4399 [Acidobacteriota bacterium]|nr:hypothetical protein [Acidobacteriota bacterium]